MRSVILGAATRLFAQRGFEQLTMAEVASAAGVQKATLYSYFDGKSALVDAAIETLLEELPVLRPLDGSRPLRQQLIDIGLQLQELAAHPAAVSLAIGIAEQRLSAKQLAAWQRRYEEFERFLAELLERHCHCEDPKQVARLFVLLVVGDLCPQSAILDKEPPRIERAVDFLLRAYPAVQLKV
nr:TetR/AcrR family transcriptional regulator [Lysobacter sp. CFH 32150]